MMLLVSIVFRSGNINRTIQYIVSIYVILKCVYIYVYVFICIYIHICMHMYICIFLQPRCQVCKKKRLFFSKFDVCGKSMLIHLIYGLKFLQDNTRYLLELPFMSHCACFTSIPNATPIQKNSTLTTFCQREFVRDILMLTLLSALDQETAWVCYVHKYTVFKK